MTATIAAVIPTRNRAPYAMNAVRSLLDQDVPVDIYVCDNSTSPDALRDFCRDEPGITYLRPGGELAAGENWDWAIRQAMKRSAATHFTVHYDRKYSKPNAWGGLAEVAAGWPDDLLSFSVDQISCEPPPLRLWQAAWTGKLFSVESQHVAELIARGCVVEIANALPILSNCLVPRDILESVLDRFGDVCNSTAPDGAFMIRFLALRDRYLHHDRALGILYGSERSNGLGYMRGAGGDFSDFMKSSGDAPYLEAAPIPGISLGSNMLYHEYELVRRVTGNHLPPLDRPAVLEELGSALRWIADPGLKADLRDILAEHGWTGREPPPLKRRWRSAVWEWVRRERMKRLGAIPPNISGFSFRTDEDALSHALRYPGRARESHRHLAMLEPVKVSPSPGREDVVPA